MLRIFTPIKIQWLRLGLNPRTWVPEASMLTTRPPKPSCLVLSWGKSIWNYNIESIFRIPNNTPQYDVCMCLCVCVCVCVCVCSYTRLCQGIRLRSGLNYSAPLFLICFKTADVLRYSSYVIKRTERL